jgi:hypothetical protein
LLFAPRHRKPEFSRESRSRHSTANFQRGEGAKVRGESLAKIGLWKLAGMRGDSDETCEIRSCDQVASSVLVIFYPYGSASIKFYCSEHEGDGVADLKRNNAGAKLIDHRARAREAQRQHRR